MKLKDYLKKFKDFDPELEVVYSADDEGNYFNKVFYDPSLVHFIEESKIVEDVDDDHLVNAVCIN